MAIRDSRGRFASRIANHKVPRALRGIWRSLRRGRIFVILDRGRPVMVFARADQLVGLVERARRHRAPARLVSMPPILGQP